MTDDARDLGSMADLVTPMALRTAATFRLADRLPDERAEAPGRSVAELAAAVGADTDALARLLRHLDAIGVVRRDAAGRYALTARGAALRDDHPGGLRRMLDTTTAIGRAELSFVHLPAAVRSGDPAYPALYGRPFWDDVAADPGRSASFAAQMGADVAADAPDIVTGYDWGSLGHVIDVGGGDATLLIALLRAYPRLRGTVLDLPDTAAAARAALAAAGLAGRGAAVAGSFFEPLPAGADGYLLSAIIHDWDDEPARAILRRCADATATGVGRVFVVEKIGADGESLRTEMDLRMLAYFGGRERGVAELAALAADAGLTVAAVHPAGALAIVELTAKELTATEETWT
jgi:hypothetical protein